MPEPEVLVLFSGGKDSMLAACHYASKLQRVGLLFCNNGCVALEHHLKHGVARLHQRWGTELIQNIGATLTTGTLQLIRMLYVQTSINELSKDYPRVTPVQLQCLGCQTAMHVEAIAYAKVHNIPVIAAGYKATDEFVTGTCEYRDKITALANRHGIRFETPMWDMPSNYDRDIAMIHYGFEFAVLEPKCMIGLPSAKPTSGEIADLMSMYDEIIQPHLDDYIENMLPFYRNVQPVILEKSVHAIDWSAPDYRDSGIF